MRRASAAARVQKDLAAADSPVSLRDAASATRSLPDYKAIYVFSAVTNATENAQR